MYKRQLTINEKVAVPVKFVGLGESFDDIQPFSAENFVDAVSYTHLTLPTSDLV